MPLRISLRFSEKSRKYVNIRIKKDTREGVFFSAKFNYELKMSASDCNNNLVYLHINKAEKLNCFVES